MLRTGEFGGEGTVEGGVTKLATLGAVLSEGPSVRGTRTAVLGNRLLEGGLAERERRSCPLAPTSHRSVGRSLSCTSWLSGLRAPWSRLIWWEGLEPCRAEVGEGGCEELGRARGAGSGRCPIHPPGSVLESP